MSIRWEAAPRNEEVTEKTHPARWGEGAGAKARQIPKPVTRLFHLSHAFAGFFRASRGKAYFPGSAARVTINAGSSCPSSVARLVGVKVSSAVCLSISFEMDL